MHTGIPTKEAKIEMETHSVTVETKKLIVQHNSKPHKLCYGCYSSIYFGFFL